MSQLENVWEYPLVSRPDALIDALNVIEEAMDGMTIGDLLDTLYIQRNADTATLLAALLRDRGWKPRTTEFYSEFIVGDKNEHLDIMELEWLSPAPRGLKVPRGYRDYLGSNRIEHIQDLGLKTDSSVPDPDDEKNFGPIPRIVRRRAAKKRETP